MKKTFLATMVALAGFSFTAWSMTYSDQDLLLAFRGKQNDVVFNVGPVSSFLTQAAGTSANVTGFDINVVNAQNAGSLSGVQAILAATRSTGNYIVYLTDSDAANGTAPTPESLVPNLSGAVTQIGNMSVIYGTATYNAAPNSSVASYTKNLPGSSSGTLPSKWNGYTGFNVEGPTNSLLPFYKFQNGATPVLIGTFSWAADGSLTFVAGNAVRPTITSAPTNVTVTLGEIASFSVAASGTPLAIQWSINGVDQLNETNATFSFTPTMDNNANLVRVTVTNQLGSVYKEVALTVNQPVSSVVQLQGFKHENGTTTFSFATEVNVDYYVLSTEDLTLPTEEWTVVYFKTADGSPIAITDDTSSNARFYTVIPVR
jgi:hypothetical protein